MPADDEPCLPDWRYPALVGCIGEARRAARIEVRFLANRIWRESLRHRYAWIEGDLSFAARRALVRATRVALRGG